MTLRNIKTSWAIALSMTLVTAARAQFALPWYTIDGGGAMFFQGLVGAAGFEPATTCAQGR